MTMFVYDISLSVKNNYTGKVQAIYGIERVVFDTPIQMGQSLTLGTKANPLKVRVGDINSVARSITQVEAECRYEKLADFPTIEDSIINSGGKKKEEKK